MVVLLGVAYSAWLGLSVSMHFACRPGGRDMISFIYGDYVVIDPGDACVDNVLVVAIIVVGHSIAF